MGRPAVCAVGDVHVAPDARSATVNGRMLVEGEMLSVDGDRGAVARGVLPLATATGGAELRRLCAWRHRGAVHD
jgi:pyruvate,orthophosphate dikinase